MDFKHQLDALFWSYGIYPQLTGKQYMIYILEQIHSGSEITPALLNETSKAFGKSRSSIYSALNIVRKKVTNYYRNLGITPPIHRNSFYDFLYWFYYEIEKHLSS